MYLSITDKKGQYWLPFWYHSESYILDKVFFQVQLTIDQVHYYDNSISELSIYTMLIVRILEYLQSHILKI